MVCYLSKLYFKKTLYLLSKRLIKDILELKGMNIIIKTNKIILIMQMINVLILIEYGMKIFGHHNEKSHVK